MSNAGRACLTLIASGTITVDMVAKAKAWERIPSLPKKVNQATGKASDQLTGFNEIPWGAYCSSYVKSAKKLSASRFDKIISLSAKVSHVEEEDDIELPDDDDDIRAIVNDDSSSSEGEDMYC